MNSNCQGHTLIELLIAMTLSLLILAALIPINGYGLRVINHQQSVEEIIGKLGQSVKQMESDIKSVGLTGCLMHKNNIRDLVFTQPLSIKNQLNHGWIAGARQGSWFPVAPYFDNNNIDGDNDAINLMFANQFEILNLNNINQQPKRIFYITNCSLSEITHGINSSLINFPYPTTSLQIFPFQSIIYYVRKTEDKFVLYRQYLSKSGHSRNEPLVDNIENLKFGFAEQINTATLEFRTADNVTNWKNIRAVYLKIEIEINDLAHSISRIVELQNVGN